MATIYGVAGDTDHVETFTLRLGGEGVPIVGAVTCLQTNIATGSVIGSATCTADADQVTYPGRFTVAFDATELVAGEYTLEFAYDGRTFPGAANARPVLVVRPDNEVV